MTEDNVYRKIAERSETGLREYEVAHRLEEMGIAELLTKIADDKEEIVIRGLADLFKINHIGLGVEGKDRTVVGNIDAKQDVRERVANEVRTHLGQIGFNFHELKDWLRESSKSLVDAALSKDADTQNSLKNRAADLPAHYINSLDKAGDAYKTLETEISWAKNAGVVDAYLTSERPDEIKTMKGLLNHSLVPTLGGLNTN